MFDMFWWGLASAFFIGLFIGSFLNVVIERLPIDKSFLSGRSVCDGCGKDLRWFELIPILSFLLLRGKCCRCGFKLSWQYPVSELTTGLLTGFVFWANWPELGFDLLLQLLFVYGLFVMALIDLKHGIIPDRVLIFLTMVAGTFWGFNLTQGFIVGFQLGDWQVFTLLTDYLIQILAGTCAALMFVGIILVSRKILKRDGLGWGDVILVFVFGMYLTPLLLLVAIYFAFVFGALIAVILVLVGKKAFGQTLPFGPFLALGATLAMFYGEQIIKLYLTWFNLIG